VVPASACPDACETPSLLRSRPHLGWVDDDRSSIGSEGPFGQGPGHDHAAARQAPDLTPRGLRTAHLETLRTPALIVQGTRDTFGSRDEIAGYRLSPAIRVVWIEEGDHSFKPPARSGRTEAQNLEEAISAAREFLLGLER